MFHGRGPEKTVVASTAEIIRWSESEIPGGTQVKAFFVQLTSTAHDWDSLNSVGVKAGGRFVWLASELEHAAYLQRYGKKAGPGAADTRATLPFFYGAPPGSGITLGFAPRAATVELDKDNTGSGTGPFRLGYLLDETPTTHYPMYTRSDSNVAASATNGRYPVTQQGLWRGFGIARTTSITDIRLYVGNRPILDLSGGLFLEAGELWQGGTISLNEHFEIPLSPIVPGETFIELTTGAAWAATDQILINSLVPVNM